MTMNRRQFLKAFTNIMAGAAISTTGFYGYGTYVEPNIVTVDHVQIPLKNLNPALHGFKIAQLSDLHIDSFDPSETIKQAVKKANALNPDLIVLTGDYVTHQAEAIFDLVPLLTQLNAKYGVYASLGNHELWLNASILICNTLEKAGIPVLVNQGVAFNAQGGTVYLAGVDDLWAGKPDLKAALAEAPVDAPVILLAHEPDFADTICLDGRVSLQLSGHSHGGQVRIPGVGSFITPPHAEKYDQGLFDVNGMWVYTNRGIASCPVPYRVNCPPEVTALTLVSAT